MIHLNGSTNAKVGDIFLKYFFADVYDKGEITEIAELTITVDFGDTIKLFQKSDCLHVFSAMSGDHMTCIAEGEIVTNFRQDNDTTLRPIETEYYDDYDYGRWFK